MPYLASTILGIMPLTHADKKSTIKADVTGQAETEVRTSVSTQRKSPRLSNSDGGFSDVESEVSISERYNEPLAVRNEDLSGESRVSTRHNNCNTESSESGDTSTEVLNLSSDGQVNSSSNEARLAFHRLIRSNAREFFSGSESMLLSLITSHGLLTGCRMFRDLCPEDVPAIQELPDKLKALADELTEAYIINEM
jgi:hypothetical protein